MNRKRKNFNCNFQPIPKRDNVGENTTTFAFAKKPIKPCKVCYKETPYLDTFSKIREYCSKCEYYPVPGSGYEKNAKDFFKRQFREVENEDEW